MITLRVMTDKLGVNINARQAVLIDGQQGNLLFAQFVQQGRGVKWMARLLHGFGEHGTVVFGQMQNTDHRIQHFGGISRPLAGDGHVEAGLIIGQQHAIAIVDKPAFRWDGQHVHPIVLGHRRVVGELGHLQKVHAPDQCTADGQHQRGAGDQSFVDQPLLGVVIF